MTPDPLLRALLEFLRIPSVSSGGGDAAALQAGAEWVAGQIEAAGGAARLQVTDRNPLVVGELPASRPGAPTVILYGHYDVQSAEPLDEWTTPPFAPDVRDGRVYGRGATDDKGQVLPLIWAARELAAAGELPVNVRFLVDGEEEIGGPSAEYWLRSDDGAADAAIAFDSRMPDPRTPILVTSARGTMHLRIDVRTASNDLHSGAGNTVLNAAHVLHRVLKAVLPDAAGRLPAALRAGRGAPTDVERDGWKRLPGGATDIVQLGGRPHDPGAVDDRYRRIGFEPSIDVHGIETGDAHQVRTQIPATARATLSMRLAPGQASAALWPVLQRMLLEAVPAGADVRVKLNNACEPARIDPRHPVTQIAVAALERAAGVAPILVPAGGSLPVLSGFAARGIPAVLTGFGTLDSRVHASDESIHLECLQLALRAARELLRGLGAYTGGANPVPQEVRNA
jgi:acetylornithine deacetylase/succinyl-diaminopimelate desuccinylase-like protein